MGNVHISNSCEAVYKDEVGEESSQDFTEQDEGDLTIEGLDNVQHLSPLSASFLGILMADLSTNPIFLRSHSHRL